MPSAVSLPPSSRSSACEQRPPAVVGHVRVGAHLLARPRERDRASRAAAAARASSRRSSASASALSSGARCDELESRACPLRRARRSRGPRGRGSRRARCRAPSPRARRGRTAQRRAPPPRSSAAAADAEARRSSVFDDGRRAARDRYRRRAPSRRARGCRARCPRIARRALRDRRAGARALRARRHGRARARHRDRRRRSGAPLRARRARGCARRAGAQAASPSPAPRPSSARARGCASRPIASSPIMPGAVSGAASTTSRRARRPSLATIFGDVRASAIEQSHERVAIRFAQARQHAAAELATLGSRGQRLRELEQRDRRRCRRRANRHRRAGHRRAQCAPRAAA